MRLPEPIQTQGQFWLPGRPDNRLSGTLAVSELGEISVDLAGAFGDPLEAAKTTRRSVSQNFEQAAPDHQRIVGVLQVGGQVTLDRCLRTNSRLTLPGGVSTSTYVAELAFIGAEYIEDEVPLFKDFSFSIEGLDFWFQISGIEVGQYIEKGRGLIKYQVPADIPVRLLNDAEIRFKFSLVGPRISTFITEATIRQCTEAIVKLKRPKPTEYFGSLASSFCNFLTLALDQPVSIQSLTGFLEQQDARGRVHPFPVRIYGQFPPWPEKRPVLNPQRALFLYPQVSSRVGDLICKWFKNHDIFNAAFSLYFIERTQSSQYVEMKILWLCQALETLHRRSSDEKSMADHEFTCLLEKVMKACPPNRRGWVESRLSHANELSFRHRIRRLVEPHKHLFGNHNQRTNLIKTICDTRNYLTHYDETTTRNRANGSDELFELYGQLEVLFQLHLLYLLGFDDSSIDSIVQANSELRRKLGA